MSEVVEKVEKIARPVVEDLGYELVEVEYAKKFDGYNLTLFINNEKGITLDDCEKVSRAMDDLLEETDPTNGESYTFNVSSLGLDRPIKSDKDFQRNLNKEIEIKFYKPFNGKKLITGYLISYNDSTVTIKSDEKLIEIERNQIAKAVLALHF